MEAEDDRAEAARGRQAAGRRTRAATAQTGNARCSITISYSSGAWRSSVARLLWEQEVAGSNPAAPIGVTGFR